jgi:hypothetical protein
MEKSDLKVIDGAWTSAPEWLDFPATLRARDPYDRNAQIRVRVAKEDAVKAALKRRRQPVNDFWAILAGKAPPVPQQEADWHAGLTSLFDATACFSGLKRPCGEQGQGEGWIAYVLKPRVQFYTDVRPPLVITTKQDVPPDLVFVAYVRMDEPSQGATRGVLTHWQFVEEDASTPGLPKDFETRYVKQLW